MKALGAVLLLSVSAYVSGSAILRLALRVSDLRALLSALEVMERELKSRLVPMEQMLFEAGKTGNARSRQFFDDCRATLSGSHEPFSLCWNTALNNSKLCLTERDKQVLADLGNVLGRYDGENQFAALFEADGQLRELIGDAKARRHDLGRVYGALGAAAGAFFVILLA